MNVHLTRSHTLSIYTGIYQPETFKREAKYGLTVLTSTDDGLLNYLNQVMGQMESWLLDGDVQRLVVVVSGVDSGETLERWQFNVQVDGHKGSVTTGGTAAASDGDENQMHNVSAAAPKTIKEIHNEIQAIIRQITASVRIPILCHELACYCTRAIKSHKTHSLDKRAGYILATLERTMLVRLARLHKQGCQGSKEVGRFGCSLHYE